MMIGVATRILRSKSEPVSSWTSASGELRKVRIALRPQDTRGNPDHHDADLRCLYLAVEERAGQLMDLRLRGAAQGPDRALLERTEFARRPVLERVVRNEAVLDIPASLGDELAKLDREGCGN